MDQAFAIRIALAMPVITGRRLMLDGTLSSILFSLTEDVETSLSQIPLRKTLGMPHGSMAILEKPCRPVSVTLVQSVVRHVIAHDVVPYIIPQASKNTTYPYGDRLDEGAEPYRNRNSTVTAYATPALWWFGVGDLELVQDLIGTLRFLGKRAGSGFGEIRDIDVERLDARADRFGLMDAKGNPLRPIPVHLWPQITNEPIGAIESESWQAPYWRTPRATCVVPPTHYRTMTVGEIRRWVMA